MSTILTRPGPPTDRTVSYGADPDQVYDVRLPPKGSPTPTVVVIHGGFWRPAYDRTHASAQSAALATAGFAVATLEYRRPSRGGWPVLSADVRAGLAAIRADATLPGPTVLVGHSAGGHLAVWLLHQPEGAQVLGTVALAGCLDLHLVHRLGLGDGAAAALMGGAPEVDPVGWLNADPARLAPPPAPVQLVHGDADTAVPLLISKRYAEEAGTSVDVVPAAGHFELIDPQEPAFAHTLAAVRRVAEAV